MPCGVNFSNKPTVNVKKKVITENINANERILM